MTTITSASPTAQPAPIVLGPTVPHPIAMEYATAAPDMMEYQAVSGEAKSGSPTLAQYTAGGAVLQQMPAYATAGPYVAQTAAPIAVTAPPPLKVKKIYPVSSEKLAIALGGLLNLGLALWLLAVFVLSYQEPCNEKLRVLFGIGWIFHTVMVVCCFLALFAALKLAMKVLAVVAVLFFLGLGIAMTVLYAQAEEALCYNPLYFSALGYFIVVYVLIGLLLLAGCAWAFWRYTEADRDEQQRARAAAGTAYAPVQSPQQVTLSPVAHQLA